MDRMSFTFSDLVIAGFWLLAIGYWLLASGF
jgi:hypothetical protein